MKLYYSPGASSLADHIALIESGLTFDLVKVDRKTRLTSEGSDYRQINPTGLVPALEIDKDNILTENVAILDYIAVQSSLSAATPIGRSRQIEILAFVASEIHKLFKPLLTPDASADAKAAAREALGSRYAILEARLGDNAFITGNMFSVADCYLFVTLLWARNFVRLDLPEGLSDYFIRIEQRATVRQALDAEGLR